MTQSPKFANLPLKTALRGDWIIVRVTEPSLMDTRLIEQLGEAMRSLIDAGHIRIVLDLSRVEYISSRMVGLIVDQHQAANSAKGQLVLCGLSDKIVELLKLTRLNKMFRVEPDLQTAADKLGVVK